MSKRAVQAIASRARRKAVPIVCDDIRRKLPKGWRCVLAVGWGVTVFDAKGRMVRDYVTGAHGASPRKLSKRLAGAIQAAETFGDIFGLGNEEIQG